MIVYKLEQKQKSLLFWKMFFLGPSMKLFHDCKEDVVTLKT